MHLYSNKNIIRSTLALAIFGLLFASCKKDAVITHYQLEGTWQLYKTTVGQEDSIYELSSDNQLKFAPRYFWLHTNGALADSGSYTLTDVVNEKDHFQATWDANGYPQGYMTIHGDTLTNVGLGFLANSAIYLRAEDETNND